jgi:DNA ligase-1
MRVLLAPSEVPTGYPKYWEKLQFPLLGSPKLDGIRGVIGPDNRVMSRTWKELPSEQVQEEFNHEPWLDGEFIEGCVTDFNVYNRTNSHVMSADKPGSITFNLFDYPLPELREEFYEKRLDALAKLHNGLDPDMYKLVEQTPLENIEEVLKFEQEKLDLGYEGVMLRTPWGRYKEGRATINEGIIYKLKRFLDAEGEVVDFVERMQNNNEKTTDERGYAKRSSHKDNKVGVGMLGKFKVLWNGKIINVAPGKFTHDELKEIWNARDFYKGKLLKFRIFAHGVKDDPRHARAIGWRDKIDL